jgi:hypothetical protein
VSGKRPWRFRGKLISRLWYGAYKGKGPLPYLPCGKEEKGEHFGTLLGESYAVVPGLVHEKLRSAVELVLCLHAF